MSIEETIKLLKEKTISKDLVLQIAWETIPEEYFEKFKKRIEMEK